MSFQWLDMRITEEKERREREALVQERLPRAFEELRASLQQCIDGYREAFGPESAEISPDGECIRITARRDVLGRWEQCAQARVRAAPEWRGFAVENGGEPLRIMVGTLPGDKLLFKHGEHYLNMEQVTQLILESVLFPDL